MAIVYDDEQSTAPAPQKFDYEAEPSPSQGVFERGAPPVRTLSTLITGNTVPTPDKYQQAAIEERDRLLKAGVPLPEGYTRRVMSGPLLGWADEAGAAMMTPFEMVRQGTLNPAEAYRYAKAREDLANQAAQEKTGLLGDAAETVGALATLPGNIFGKQLSVALGGSGKGVLPALGRMVGYGAESGALGAIQGAGNARTTNDMVHDALTGGAFSAALGAPFGIFANVAPRSTAAIPSEAELFGLGKRDYRARDRVPVSYDAQAVGDRFNNLRQATQNRFAYDAPTTVRALDDRATEASNRVAAANVANAGNAPPGSLVPGGQYSGAPNPWTAIYTPREISSIRRNLQNDVAGASSTDQYAGKIASGAIDRILSRPNPNMLAPGSTLADASLAASLDSRGRQNFGAAYRSKVITGAVNDALNQASAAHSGLNIENTLRQRINAARKADEFVGYTPAEEAGAAKLIQRGAKADALRELSGMLGGGGGLGRMVAMGGGGLGGGAVGAYLIGQDPVYGALVGLGAGLAGRGIRTYGNRRAVRDAEAFASELRKRSPEYAARVARAPTTLGPGLSSPMSGLRTTTTLGAGGNLRNAIASAILKQFGLQSPEDL